MAMLLTGCGFTIRSGAPAPRGEHVSQHLKDLISLLELERIEDTIFRGQSQDLGFHALFGGQVIGQALAAAERTVAPQRSAHSLHGYFLRPGDPSRPVVYVVEPIRDGRTTSTRRVTAVQKGRPIFLMSASFQIPTEGLEHQDPMPEIPAPEDLEPPEVFAERLRGKVPERVRRRWETAQPFEIRWANAMDPARPRPMPPRRHTWLRTAGPLPGDPRIHRHLLAYVSDFNLLVTALNPHGLLYWDPRLRMASIDHCMWFHRPFRADEWLLYAVDSPTATSGRALVRGRFFDRSGRLVASTAQEGLIRLRPASASGEGPGRDQAPQ